MGGGGRGQWKVAALERKNKDDGGTKTARVAKRTELVERKTSGKTRVGVDIQVTRGNCSVG